MPAPGFYSWRSFAVLLLVVSGLFLLQMGTRGLNEPDEGRYANIAAGFLKPNADWMEPRLSGYGHYDKPPLIYWITGLCFLVGGINEWSARFPSFIGALLTLVGVGWIGFRLKDAKTAWWSVLITGTLAQFWLLARFLTPDMMLTGWSTLGVAAWTECRHQNGSWKWWGVSLLFWTLAWWTKATPVFVPLLGLIIGLTLTRDWKGLQALRPARLIGAMLVLGLPWFLLMIARHPELKQFFLGRQMAGHITGQGESRRGPIWYHLALAPFDWMPWSFILVGLWIYRKWIRKESINGIWGLTEWMAAIGLIIFSLNSSKLPTYTLLLTPWVGLSLANFWLRIKGDEACRPALAIVALFYIGCFGLLNWVYPKYETKLGANSSLRSVATELQEQGATFVVLDRYWPGFDLYFKGDIFYAVRNWIQQRSDDSRLADPQRTILMLDPSSEPVSLLLPNRLWLVHYRKASDVAQKFVSVGRKPVWQKEVGDFVIQKFE